jgi:hypothetical protein
MAPLRTCPALAIAWAFICVLAIPIAVHGQSAQPSSQPAPTQQTSPTAAAEGEDGSKLPVSLDRIREGIQRDPKLKLDFLDPTIPLFRVSVHEKGLKLEDYWKIGPDTAVSRDVRTYHASQWHHDFLSMTTPKQHIAASPFGLFGNPAFPVGPPVLAIGSALKKAFSNMERGRIRRQIQEELKTIDANKSQQAQQTQQPQEPQQPEQPPAKQPDSKQPKQP